MEEVLREAIRTCVETIIIDSFAQPAHNAPTIVTMSFQSETKIEYQEVTDRREAQPARIQTWKRTQGCDWNDYEWRRERSNQQWSETREQGRVKDKEDSSAGQIKVANRNN